ncbi:MAG: efflux RND transporter periplasmic adaptor subunit [Gemmatimonadales bacterium]
MKVPMKYLTPLLLLGACHKAPPAVVYQAVPVVRRDIVVTAEAAGAINPDTTVQVKSKASGEILNIPVSTGDHVTRGTLIVQVDPRIPQNDVDQARAALQVDSAQFDNAKAQYKREQELYTAKAVTQQELETSELAVKVANANMVRDAIALENAKISLADTKVLAPITGTVINIAVQRGTVISSPTNSASGGTVILTMADLGLVQVKTWVDESDVGKLHAGQIADVSVQAYPNRPFQGEVLKIEPQADTIQNVTMFPVDVRIDNKNDLLKPGMNADVRVQVAARNNVLAVPNAALRTDRDVASAGLVLGIAPNDLQTMLADAKTKFDNLSAQRSDTGAQTQLPGPGGQQAQGADSSGGRRHQGGNGGGNAGAGNTAAGNAGNAAGRGNGGGRFGGGNGGGGFGGGRGGRGRGGRGSRSGGSDYMFGGRYIVFAEKAGKPTPVYIQTGITDLDYSEVRIGALAEGDSVLMLPSASLIESQQQMQQRMSRNAGLPGQTTKPQAGNTSGAAAGGGGAARGGRGG